MQYVFESRTGGAVRYCARAGTIGSLLDESGFDSIFGLANSDAIFLASVAFEQVFLNCESKLSLC